MNPEPTLQQPTTQAPVPEPTNVPIQPPIQDRRGNGLAWLIPASIVLCLFLLGITRFILMVTNYERMDLPTFVSPFMSAVNIAQPNSNNTSDSEIANGITGAFITPTLEPIRNASNVTPTKTEKNGYQEKVSPTPTVSVVLSPTPTVTPGPVVTGGTLATDGVITVEPGITAKIKSVERTADKTKLTIVFTNTGSVKATFWPVRFVINSPTHGGGVSSGPLDMELKPSEIQELTFEYEYLPGGSPYIFSYTTSAGGHVTIGTLTF